MNPIDVGIVVLYVVACSEIGARLGSSAKGLKGYFLGESDLPAWAVMISIVATETSTVTFLSVPGESYKGDFTYLQLAMGYLIGRVVVSRVLLPAYFKGRIDTAYELLQTRFGGPTRRTASILFLVTRSIADGLRLFLAAKVLQYMTDWPIWGSIVAMGIATIVYTYLGGMKAVVWTDVIQFVIYIVGALVALAILIRGLPGGWAELVEQGRSLNKFRLFNFSTDLTIPFTFWAGLIGGMVLNTATHGADQLMVQRYLTARSERQAAGALIVSGAVVFAQFALFLLIGVALFAFYKVHPPNVGTLGQDDLFAYFIVHYLPVGVKGLVIAAIFSAAMSTLSGSLNASASTTVNDLYRPLTGDADEARLLRLSRGLTAFWGVVQIGVAIAAIGFQRNVLNNALAVASFVTGILLGLFLLGILTTRVGQRAALVGMLAGVAAVSFAKFGTSLAWPWFALVGSTTVFTVGVLASAGLSVEWSASANEASST
ncbi:MAG: sodium:solute symporter [Isosphaeraceae bacterium]